MCLMYDLSSAQTAKVSSVNNTDEGDSANKEGKIIFDYICTEDGANVNSTPLIPPLHATNGRRRPVWLVSVLVAICTLHY